MTASAKPSSTQGSIELSIVLPCLNEAETLAICIKKASTAIKKHRLGAEIIIADNGSTDGSQDIAKSLGARVVNVKEKGYGNALMGGFNAAKGDYIIMADADDSYDLSKPMPFLKELRKGKDLVMGNRFKGGIKKGAMPFLHKYLGNPVLSFIGRLFFKSKIRDFHCGMRGFKRKAILDLNLQTTGMEFASEMVMKCTLFNLSIAEVPIVLHPDGRSRPPHLRTWRDGWRHLRFMLLYAPNWLFLYPGLVLMAAGISLFLWIQTGPKFIGITTLDIHTLLFSAAFILLGFQAITFSVFSKTFAHSEGLAPLSKSSQAITRLFNFEKCLILGSLLIFTGLLLSLQLIGIWKAQNYGTLDPHYTFRILIPAILTMIMGGQCILFGSFISTLKLARK